MKLFDRNFWLLAVSVSFSAGLLFFILANPPTPRKPERVVAVAQALPEPPKPAVVTLPPAPTTVVATAVPAEPPKPRFILLLDGGRPVLYEILKEVQESDWNSIKYVNGDGVKRSWRGTSLISELPIKFLGEPMVAAPAGAQFKAN